MSDRKGISRTGRKLTAVEWSVLRIVTDSPGVFFGSWQRRLSAAAKRLAKLGRIKAGPGGGWIASHPEPVEPRIGDGEATII